MNIQGQFPLGLTDLMSLQSKDSQESSPAPWFESINYLALRFLYGPNLTLTRWTFVDKVMSLLFNTLFAFTMAFLLRSKHLLISWLQSSSTVILEPKKIKSLAVSTLSPSICHEVIGPDAMISVFECWVLSQLFHSPLSPSSRGSLVPLCFLPLGWCHLHIWFNFSSNKVTQSDTWEPRAGKFFFLFLLDDKFGLMNSC